MCGSVPCLLGCLASLTSTKFCSAYQSLRPLTKPPKSPSIPDAPLGAVPLLVESTGLRGGLTQVCRLLAHSLSSPLRSESSSSKKSQHFQDYLSPTCMLSSALDGLGAQPRGFPPPLSGPRQPSRPCVLPSRNIFSAFVSAASERKARCLLFIYMGITGDQKSALK